MSLTMAAVSTFKVVAQDSRPYIIYQEIETYNCECSFGLPSTQLAFSASAFFMLFSDLPTIYRSVNLAQPSKKRVNS